MLLQFMSPMNWSSLQTINSGDYSAPLYLKQPKLWIFFEDTTMLCHNICPWNLIVICPWTEYILLIECTNGIFFSLLVSVTFLEMWLYDSPIRSKLVGSTIWFCDFDCLLPIPFCLEEWYAQRHKWVVNVWLHSNPSQLFGVLWQKNSCSSVLNTVLNCTNPFQIYKAFWLF